MISWDTTDRMNNLPGAVLLSASSLQQSHVILLFMPIVRMNKEATFTVTVMTVLSNLSTCYSNDCLVKSLFLPF